MRLDNLGLLHDDMRSKEWSICSFLFEYNQIEYIVLVKRFVEQETRINRYALVKLHFMEKSNLSRDLIVEANRGGLIINAQSLRAYFNIQYHNNVGDILTQFTNRLNTHIPINIPKAITSEEQKAMVHSLSKSDSEDPNKIYCTSVRRNNGSRSIYNSDKTKLLRADLFEHFKNNQDISFCYSDNKELENDDKTILMRFAKNNGNR